MSRVHGRGAAVVIAALVLSASCSAGDPPDPEAARASLDRPAPSEGSAAPTAEPDHEEAELSDADDATLDALEERFEDQGVKDIRGDPGAGVTIRLEDELTRSDAVPSCSAVRAAGFAEVRVDVDDVVAACP